MKQFILAVLVIAVAAAAWGTVPPTMSYQGIFMDNEGNIMPDGTYFIGFHIFSAQSGGPPMWSEWQEVEVSDGLFNVVLGSQVPLTPGLFPKAGSWFQMSYEEEFLEPRQPFTSVPYAFRSCVCAHCDSLGLLTQPVLDARHDSLITALSGNDTEIDRLQDSITVLRNTTTSLQTQINNLQTQIDNIGSTDLQPRTYYSRYVATDVDVPLDDEQVSYSAPSTFTVTCSTHVIFHAVVDDIQDTNNDAACCGDVRMRVEIVDASNDQQVVSSDTHYHALPGGPSATGMTSTVSPLPPGTYYLKATLATSLESGGPFSFLRFGDLLFNAMYFDCPVVPSR